MSLRRVQQAALGVAALTLLAGCATDRATQTPSAQGASAAAVPARAGWPEGYAELVALFEAFRADVPPKMRGFVPDYTAEAMEARGRLAREYLDALGRIDDSDWPIPFRVDYMLVLAEMRALDFQHRVLRPWEKDPAFYSTTSLGFGPKMHGAMTIPELPLAEAEVDTLGARLSAVPDILAQARANLTDARGDLARRAIAQKTIERNVYDQLARGLAVHHPHIAPAALAARDATADFLAWLDAIEDQLPPHGGIGAENYDWYLRHVMLFPYTAEEMAIIAQREYERSLTFLKIEENEHRELPMTQPVETLAAFKEARRQTDLEMLAFLQDEQIMTVPDWFEPPEPSGPYVLPGDRDPQRGGPFDPPVRRHFFRQAEDRNNVALRAHNLPGHHFDSRMSARDDRAIRGAERLFFISGARTEGWAMYLEEMILQAGMMDDDPKAREITYILQTKRAARVLPEIKLHANEWTFEEALHSLTSRTPYWMGPRDAIALFDLELYLRQPGYGIGYYMGKVEFEALLADVAQRRGPDFNLRAFHDEVHAKGLIPLSLIRWEMTGDDSQVRHMR